MTPVEAQIHVDRVAGEWLVFRMAVQPDRAAGLWHFMLRAHGTQRHVILHEDDLRDPVRCRAALAERMAA